MSLVRSVRDLIQAYRTYDPAAKSNAEILLLYPGPRALLTHRIANALYRRQFYFLARFFCELGRSLTGIEIHPGATVGERLVIDHGMGVVIGETAQIGNDCIIFHGVTLGGMKFENTKRHPTVGHRVLIGAGAKILGPVYLSDDCRIGANAVITKDVPTGRTAVGNPMRVLE